MENKRKICVVTGTRAEYGLLYWLLSEIRQDSDLILQLIVTGMHLSPEFGLTYKTIEQDGFQIDAKVEMLLSSDTPVGIAKSIGLGVIGFAEAIDRLRPDIIVLLGDRYEILAVAQAAMVARVPIAHIHGGELTEGLIDEAIRHAVTKMAHFHFVAAEPYRCRVIQLGENPDRVFNFGAIGLDNVQRLNLLSREEFEQQVGMKLGDFNILVTYHPVTLLNRDNKAIMSELFTALDYSIEQMDSRILFTKPNADTDGRVIARMIDEYVWNRRGNAYAATSLGQIKYLSALTHFDLIMGNSSSGLIEVPVFKKPTINIGDRQKGRLRASSVLDCHEDSKEIIWAIEHVRTEDFLEKVKNVVSPYGSGSVSNKIRDYLKTVSLEGVLAKEFVDWV